MFIYYCLFNFFLFCFSLNLLNRYYTDDDITIQSRRYSSIHAFSISLLMFIHILFPYQFLIEYGLSLTTAYAIFDLAMIISHSKLYRETRPSIYFHHLALGFLPAWTIDKPFYYLCAEYGLLSEFSTLFLNHTWILKKKKAPANQIRFWSILTLVSWVLLRNVNYTYLLYLYLFNTDWIPLMALIYIWSVNVNWLVKMLRKYYQYYIKTAYNLFLTNEKYS